MISLLYLYKYAALRDLDVQNQALEQQAGPGTARGTERIISLDLNRKERLRVHVQVIESAHSFHVNVTIHPALDEAVDY